MRQRGRIRIGRARGRGVDAHHAVWNRLALCCALALIALAALVPSAASAAQAHKFSAAFGAPGAGAGQLALDFPTLSAENKPITAGSGVAVDDETGDVYVADTGNHRVSEFTATGTFIRAFGADVGGAGVDVCTATCVAGTSGSAPGQLGTPTFIAVDNSAGPSHGDVYVADSADNVISKFDAAGALVTSWGTGGQLDGSGAEKGPFGAHLNGIGVDIAGNLWVQAGAGGAEVFEFNQAGAFIQNWAGVGQQPTGLALDGAEHIYLLDGFPRGPIHRFSTTGTDLGAVYGPAGTFISGITADQAHNDLYVDEEGTSIGDISSRCDPAAGECSPVQVFGEGDLHAAAGLAIDSATGTLYAASTADDQIAVFAVAVEATIGAATEVKATTAILHGELNPEGSLLSRCIFEYGEGAAEGHASVPCQTEHGEPLDGNTPIAVHADVSGLSGGTRYAFRLRATNAAGDVKSEEEELHTLALPTIEAAEATDITAETAVLKAEINPRGLATTCQIEYGTSTAYGTTIPCEPANLGAGTGPVPVSGSLQGLSPGTTYHFRFLAGSPDGTATGPDQTFVFLTGPEVEQGCSNEVLRQANGSLALPDCRAYELVTPARKNGALIGAAFLGGVAPQISADGSSVAVNSIQCFADAQACTASRQNEGALFEFTRTESGWATTPLAPPASAFQTSEWLNFSPDAHTALYSIPGPLPGQDDLYVRNPDGTFTLIGPLGEGETTFTTLGNPPRVSDSVPARIVYQTRSPVWSFDNGASGAVSLYEYAGVENSSPQLVGVSGGAGSTDLISSCNTGLGGNNSQDPSSKYNSLSADGRIVYFTAKPCSTGTGTNAGKEVPANQLYERVDEERTVHVSAAASAGCTTAGCQGSRSGDARFEGASNDGSEAFFTSTQQLTDEASEDHAAGDSAQNCTTTSAAAAGCNLYESECPDRCEQPSQRRLIDVSAGAQSTGGPRVQGTVAISPDGSHIYFVAKGVLTATPNTQGQSAQEGADNLYLYSGGRLTFVGALAPSDREDWRFGGSIQGLGIANVTPDGRFLVFGSHRALTSGADPAEGASQIYRFDAATGTLTRVSIGRRGFNDDGNSGHADASIVAAFLKFALSNPPTRANPTMSDDGRYVFFQSPVALTPLALNEVQLGTEESEGKIVPYYAQNVYEWEEQGAGGCIEPSGCVTLLSDGREVVEGSKISITSPELLGTDAEGKNVFIAASDRLTWQDTDSQRDYYDLRVNGGFAPPSEPAICKGDACKGPGTQAGAEQGPATPGFSGPSEGPKTPPGTTCKKGFVKKGGKCVKKHQTTKKRHKKSNKKGQKNHKRTADHDRGGGK
jgi:DNA-binding beta-propeller fold protein YncE